MASNSGTFSVTAETLVGIDLARNLPGADRAALAGCCHGLVYEEGQIIVSPDDRDRAVYFVVTGSVRVAHYAGSGREVIFRELRPGAMFGELAAIDNEARSAHVLAGKQTRLVRIAQRDFLGLLERNGEINRALMTHLTRLVRLLSERVFEKDTYKVDARIHREILRQAEQNEIDNQAVIEHHSDERLAHVVGTDRSAVNKALRRLQREKLLDKRPGRMTVPDVAALRRLVESEEA